ncbi:hypothetical protein GTB64_004544 [Salmonella enterica]|nr:hypothetical protein [Salmonella enterica]
MKLITPQAADAFDWLTERMPDSTYAMFAEDVENAIRDAAARFGFDLELINAFGVDRIVPDRNPLTPANDRTTAFQAIVFEGRHKHAVIGSGKIFRLYQKEWKPSDLTLEEVKKISLTRSSQTIHIKAKYL